MIGSGLGDKGLLKLHMGWMRGGEAIAPPLKSYFSNEVITQRNTTLTAGETRVHTFRERSLSMKVILNL